MANIIVFSDKEIEYLKSQRLARIATAAYSSLPSSSSSAGSIIIQPDVVPVGFDFDGKYFYYVSGINILKSTTKYKNVLKNNKVALVIDDLKSVDPWNPRGIRIYGTADIVSRQDGYMERGTDHPNNNPHKYIRIRKT